MRLQWDSGGQRSMIGGRGGSRHAAAANEVPMTVYSGPVFDMAARQFGVIADYLEIPHDERDRLLLPKRAITVSCPIHRDDGSVAVFEGYRVQHHLTLGPTKGGTRFAPNVDIIFLDLRDHRHCGRRGMYPSLRFGFGNALYAMGS